MKSYLRAASLLFNQPLLTTPDAMDMAVRWANQVMSLNIINMAPAAEPRMWHDDDDYESRIAREEERRRANLQATGVQVIPVHGLLVSRAAHLNVCETMTSYEDLRSQLRQAVADPLVERIVLDIDSPGALPPAHLSWRRICGPWLCKSKSSAWSISRPTAAAT